MSHKLKTIPLCQLRAGRENIRKTDRLAGVSAMAANIHEKDLLENLVVQTARLPNGHDPIYNVVAGGRRLAALKLLAKRRKIARDHPVRCLILEDKDSGVEVSLAENMMRAPLHPADQFEAFAALAAEGLSVDEMAARFGVTPAFVAQRLKLAAVSPRLVGEYRAGAMTLEQLTAFTLTDSHAAQEEVWFERPYADMPAQMIRRLLTRAQVPGTDTRARFVGVETYMAAGGSIVRDLFDAEDEGYFSDSVLLDRLVAEKLETVAAQVRAENWQWVELHPLPESALLGRFARAEPVEHSLGEAEESRLAELSDRYDELSAAAEDGEEEAIAQLTAVETELNGLLMRRVTWPDEAKARSGAVVYLGHDGNVEIVRGLLTEAVSGRVERTQEATRRKSTNGGQYSESVLLELSAQRTAVIRELLAEKPDVAHTALLHALVSRLFYSISPPTSLTLTATEVPLDRASAFVGQSKAAQDFLIRHNHWTERLPEPDLLWDYLAALEGAERSELLAHCIALTANALHGNAGRNAGHADRLADALGVEMENWWRPTRANFLDRITKNDILAAVSEGASQQAAWRLAGLKKERMAKEAEKLLSDTAWLPVPLRRHSDILSS